MLVFTAAPGRKQEKEKEMSTRGVRGGRRRTVSCEYPSGARYDGQCRAGDRDGYGVFRYPSGDVYEGQWRLGQPHGQGRLCEQTTHDSNGHYRFSDYTGEWQEGMRHGEGRLVQWTSPSPILLNMTGCKGDEAWVEVTVYEGSFFDDEFQGNGTLVTTRTRPHQGSYCVETTTRYTGEFKAGAYSGVGEVRNDEGRYEGRFAEGRHHGYGKLTTSDGEEWSGVWQKGELIFGIESTSRRVQTSAFGLPVQCERVHAVTSHLLEYLSEQAESGKLAENQYLELANRLMLLYKASQELEPSPGQ